MEAIRVGLWSKQVTLMHSSEMKEFVQSKFRTKNSNFVALFSDNFQDKKYSKCLEKEKRH